MDAEVTEQDPLVAGARWLLAYFERVDQAHPGRFWNSGAELCRRWIALTAHPTEDEVNALSAQLDAEMIACLAAQGLLGHGWRDLVFGFHQWASEQGFTAQSPQQLEKILEAGAERFIQKERWDWPQSPSGRRRAQRAEW